MTEEGTNARAHMICFIIMITGWVLGGVSDQWMAWSIIFHSFGGICILCTIAFMMFASTDVQDFDDVRQLPTRDLRSMSIVSAMSYTYRSTL